MKKKKTQFESCTVRGCPAEARVDKPNERKLDPKTITCYFIYYLQRYKGYRVFYPNHTTRIAELGNAKFLESDNDNGRTEP